jgi:hypothetical protein
MCRNPDALDCLKDPFLRVDASFEKALHSAQHRNRLGHELLVADVKDVLPRDLTERAKTS